MTNIDLRQYVVAKWGTWFRESGRYCADALRLETLRDGLALAGPLRVRVSVVARNELTLLGTSSNTPCEREAFGYVLDIPPGQTWSYPHPQATKDLEDVAKLLAPPSDKAATDATTANAKLTTLTTQEETTRALAERLATASLRLGTNAGFALVIRLAGPENCGDPCAVDPCAPRDECGKRECGCNCQPCQCGQPSDGVPCNFAQRGGGSANWYFPSACEPCAPGAKVAAPPSMGATLLVPPASGGTKRTRYFNGMFITREDLETDQRNVRLKRALMNRAMGQGVVWGFDLATDGNAVCVQQGYGVDCCGNDVVLSAPYRVDLEALVRDPAARAALSSREPQRMSLVLEYYECPDDPRPVHGDPCSTDVSRCEMSRIRETARLRLAPPCDVDDSGCIKDFLAEVEKLRNDAKLKDYFAPAATPAATPIAQVPFSIEVSVTLSNVDIVFEGTTGPMQPLTPTGRVEADSGAVRPPSNDGRAREWVEIKATIDDNTTGWAFKSGTPAALGSAPAVDFVQSDATTISWRVPMPDVFDFGQGTNLDIPPEVSYELQDWSVTDSNGNTYSAPFTQIDLTLVGIKDWRRTAWGRTHTPPDSLDREDGVALHVSIPASDVSVIGPRPFPCLSEGCDPSGAPRFKVTPPWLHENPEKPGKAADPSVLALALVYAVLAGVQARNGTSGSSLSSQAGQAAVANALYNAVFKASFATAPITERYALTSAIRKLLQCWCKSLLYPGPSCHCEPHGVVVGCARVEGGRIVSVDPWGGRRWVVHYPLLSYWGQQFGIMPFDAIASKLFDTICCIACLPLPGRGRGAQNDTATAFESFSTASGGDAQVGRSSAVPLGAGVLLFEPSASVNAKVSAFGASPTRTVTVSPMEFATRLWTAAQGAPTGAASSGALVRLVPLGFPDVHLLVPDTDATSAAAGGSLDAIVAPSATGGAPSASVAPLLRGYASTVTKQVLAATALAPTDDAQRAAAASLASAGVKSVADVLARDPDALLAGPLGGKNAVGLSGLLGGAEGTASQVASAVAASVAAQTDAIARADFADPRRADALRRAIEDRLASAKIAVAPSGVGKAVGAGVTRS